jgi:hypothetical protein
MIEVLDRRSIKASFGTSEYGWPCAQEITSRLGPPRYRRYCGAGAREELRGTRFTPIRCASSSALSWSTKSAALRYLRGSPGILDAAIRCPSVPPGTAWNCPLDLGLRDADKTSAGPAVRQGGTTVCVSARRPGM